MNTLDQVQCQEALVSCKQDTSQMSIWCYQDQLSGDQLPEQSGIK